MTTNSSSATAYERLADLTYGFNAASELADAWGKLSRASRFLVAALTESGDADPKTVEILKTVYTLAVAARKTAWDASQKLQADADLLNAQIQNGVYND